MNVSWNYEPLMSPALNGSSAIQHFEGNDAIEIRDGITFDFYTRLPHLQNSSTLGRLGTATLGICPRMSNPICLTECRSVRFRSWSCLKVDLIDNHDGPRTNNHVEGWYNHLKKMARKAYSNIFWGLDSACVCPIFFYPFFQSLRGLTEVEHHSWIQLP